MSVDILNFLSEKLDFIFRITGFEEISFLILLLNPISLIPQFWIIWKKYRAEKPFKKEDSDLSLVMLVQFLIISLVSTLIAIKEGVMVFFVSDILSVFILILIITLFFLWTRKRQPR